MSTRSNQIPSQTCWQTLYFIERLGCAATSPIIRLPPQHITTLCEEGPPKHLEGCLVYTIFTSFPLNTSEVVYAKSVCWLVGAFDFGAEDTLGAYFGLSGSWYISCAQWDLLSTVTGFRKATPCTKWLCNLHLYSDFCGRLSKTAMAIIIIIIIKRMQSCCNLHVALIDASSSCAEEGLCQSCA